MAKTLKCPKCKSVDIEIVNEKTRTTLNFNPLHPFTLVNHKPTGKVKCRCKECGRIFDTKI